MEKCGCIKKKRTKFILSMISSVFNIITHGIIIGVSGLSVYIFSYIYYKDKWVNMQYGNLTSPLMSLSLSLFSPLSGPLEKSCGPIISLIISNIIIEICFFLYYLQRNIWYFYSITLLMGIGTGLSTNILLKNSCFYYPKHKGLISSGIMSFMGVSASGYILLVEQLVNPDKIEAANIDTIPIYPEYIAQNFKKYFIFAMIALPIGTVLTIIFFYKYDPSCEEEEEDDEEKKIENKEISENTEKKEEMNEILVKNQKPKKKFNSFYKPTSGKNVKQVLKSFRFWRNIIITSFLPFYFSFINSSFRAYAVMIGVDQGILYYLGSVISLISCFLVQYGPL